MKFKIFPLLLFILGLCRLGSPSAFAATPEQPPAFVQFRLLTLSGQVDEIYYADSRGKLVELSANDYVRSSFYRASGREPLVIFRLLPPAAGQTKPRREPVGTLQWPDGSGPFLILVAKEGDGYYFNISLDDTQSFPLGGFRVVNASTHNIGIKVQDKITSIVSRDSAVIVPSLEDGHKSVLFQVGVMLSPPKLVYSNIWNSSPRSRTLVFIFDRENTSNLIGVKRLSESDLVINRMQSSDSNDARE